MAGSNGSMGETEGLPFRTISDYDMLSLQSSQRAELIEKFENNGFIKYFRNHRTDVPESSNSSFKKQYFDIEEFNSVVSNIKSGLNLCHLNVRRIAKNKGKFFAFLNTLKRDFDVIILTEVGDNAQHFLNENFLPDYNVELVDLPLNNKYGGTAILVKKGSGRCTPRDDLKIKLDCGCTPCAIENSWIEINTGQNKYLLGGIYRHCNGDISHFVDALQNSLSKIDPNTTAIICGDININILNLDHSGTSDYYTTLSSHNFIPHILTPTRITDHGATCLDHIFVRLPVKKIDNEIISGNIISDISDHLPNFLVIHDTKDMPKTKRPFVRIFGEKNINSFKNLLDNSNWETVLQGNDINHACENFYNHILTLYNTSFPYVQLSRKREKDKKWITQGLLKSCKKKDMLYKKQLSKPTEDNVTKYKKYRNILNSLLNQAEINYFENEISDKKSGINNFWKSFGPSLNPSKFT